MAVGEGDFEGVVAGGLQVGDADAGFAGLQFGLSAPVAAHFGAGGIHAQVFGGQGVFGVVLRRFLFEPGGVVEHEAGHGEEGEGGEDECADDPVGKSHQAPEGLLHDRWG